VVSEGERDCVCDVVKLGVKVPLRDCDSDGVKLGVKVPLRDCVNDTVAQDDCVRDVVNEELSVLESEYDALPL
jgi:hypothetical protein